MTSSGLAPSDIPGRDRPDADLASSAFASSRPASSGPASVRQPGRAVLRFAPSPNGYLHAGHAFSALLNQQLARQLNGALLLRIENIDTIRCRPEFEAAMLTDLEWLGVQFDGAPRRQSDHFDTYRAYIARLTDAGLTYPCFCTRTDIASAVAGSGAIPRDTDGAPVYPGTCRGLGMAQIAARHRQGRPFALRLNMAAALRISGNELTFQQCDINLKTAAVPVAPEAWGDVILARKETPTSYHVSVVVDDALQGVSHVVRGKDLEAATAVHRLLQVLWKFEPPIYLHHDLLRDDTGEKLAKSLRSKPLRQLRAEGVTPGQLRVSLGFDA